MTASLTPGPEMDKFVCERLGIPRKYSNHLSRAESPFEPVSTDRCASLLVVDAMEKTDWRLTLMAPGGFTDEGLGGGDVADGKWTAFFKRPNPEGMKREGESYETYRERVEDFNNTGYGEGESMPEAICRAALAATEGSDA